VFGIGVILFFSCGLLDEETEGRIGVGEEFGDKDEVFCDGKGVFLKELGEFFEVGIVGGISLFSSHIQKGS